MGVVRPGVSGRGGRLSNTWLTCPRDGDNPLGKVCHTASFSTICNLRILGLHLNLTLDYIAGFFDGEGSIIVRLKKDPRYHAGYQVVLKITLHQKSKAILEEILKSLGVDGKIYFHKR